MNYPGCNPLEETSDHSMIQSLLERSEEVLKVDQASQEQLAAYYMHVPASSQPQPIKFSDATKTLKALKNVENRTKNPTRLHRLLKPLKPPQLIIPPKKGKEKAPAVAAVPQEELDDDIEMEEVLEKSRKETFIQNRRQEKGKTRSAML